VIRHRTADALRLAAGVVLSISCLLALSLFLFRSTSAAPTPPKTAAVPRPPTGSELGKCFAFSKPVTFKVESIKQTFLSDLSGGKTLKPVWAYSYSAEKQTLSSYTVELYKARTLFGKKRGEVEKEIVKHDREIKKEYPGKRSDISAVETRPAGRKVYFTTLGFGPGGAFQVVFTTIGNCDIALTQFVDLEDDMPEEQKIKNPAIAKKRPLEAFRLLEHYIVTRHSAILAAERGAAPREVTLSSSSAVSEEKSHGDE
jgi:hypothetical protein